MDRAGLINVDGDKIIVSRFDARILSCGELRGRLGEAETRHEQRRRKMKIPKDAQRHRRVDNACLVHGSSVEVKIKGMTQSKEKKVKGKRKRGRDSHFS